MALLKLLGVLLVVGSTSAVGFSTAASVRRQSRQLRELIDRLREMKGEIAYRLTPLPELLLQQAEACRTEVRAFFQRFAELLCERTPRSVASAGAMALERTKGLALEAQTLEEVRSLCQSLGKLDLEGQLQSLELTADRLERQFAALEAGKRARCRSYQTIGVCAGLAAAVILL